MEKGLARAPAATGTSTGVSTSVKPRPSRKARTAAMILLLRRNTAPTSGLEIRSRYRCRYRCSVSRRPCHFSGMGLRDLDSTVRDVASTVTSPLRVRKTGPVTPRKSPRSSSRTRAYPSSQDVPSQVGLHPARPVPQVQKGGLAHDPQGHDAPGDGHGPRPRLRAAAALRVLAPLRVLETRHGLGGGAAPAVPRRERVDPKLAQAFQLLSAAA